MAGRNFMDIQTTDNPINSKLNLSSYHKITLNRGFFTQANDIGMNSQTLIEIFTETNVYTSGAALTFDCKIITIQKICLSFQQVFYFQNLTILFGIE
uniref:Uncharacterized protein n=1 Tax=Timema shepardi TaxID=629360 RepID=A0A7R9APE6_TIMSH|nr:unnamed protein product [Timema shepardi]